MNNNASRSTTVFHPPKSSTVTPKNLDDIIPTELQKESRSAPAFFSRIDNELFAKMWKLSLIFCTIHLISMELCRHSSGQHWFPEAIVHTYFCKSTLFPCWAWFGCCVQWHWWMILAWTPNGRIYGRKPRPSSTLPLCPRHGIQGDGKVEARPRWLYRAARYSQTTSIDWSNAKAQHGRQKAFFALG